MSINPGQSSCFQFRSGVDAWQLALVGQLVRFAMSAERDDAAVSGVMLVVISQENEVNGMGVRESLRRR